MKLFKLIFIILLFPSVIFSLEDIPEWERVDITNDTLRDFGVMNKNSKNEIFIIYQSGIFKSTDTGESWSRLNMPDTLIYDEKVLEMNGPTIYTYGKVYNMDTSSQDYFVYSNDYGENWHIQLKDKLVFSGYQKSDFKIIDDNGEIWGISSNKKIDTSSKLVINKFNVITRTATKMFEIPYSYSRIYLTDSLTLLFNYKPFINKYGGVSQWKELHIYYTKNNGKSWDSLTFNEENTENYYWIKGENKESDFLFESKGIIFTKDSYQYNDNILYGINLMTKKMEIGYDSLPNGNIDEVKKINDSTFYCLITIGDMPQNTYLYKSTDMKSWNKIFEYEHDLNHPLLNWITDEKENHYFYYETGIVRIKKEDSTFTYLSDKGIELAIFEQIAVDSKSNIVMNKMGIDSYRVPNIIFIMYNQNTKHKQISWKDNYSKAAQYQHYNYLDCFKNDIFCFVSQNYSSGAMNNFGTTCFFNDLTDYSDLKVNENTYIQSIDIFSGMGKNYIAETRSGEFGKYNYGTAFSDDYCQTWKILDSLECNNNISNGHYINAITSESELLSFERYAKIYKSKGFGKLWVLVFNDSSNPAINSSKFNSYVNNYSYNQNNGSGIITFSEDGPIYFTIDHGKNWKSISPNQQAYNFIKQNNVVREHSLYQDVIPKSYDNTFTFYVNTYDGIYRSTDTLKSFKCISKNKVEPSNISKLICGNDGRLYAMNCRGIWRTKEKVISSVENNQVAIEGNINLLISPNPASDYIEIFIPENTNHTLKGMVENKVQIFDILGIEVGQSSLIDDKNRIDISNLPTGVYFIKITGSNGDGSIVEKFFKK